ncbi:putative ribonuclease H-like domain-containing protein [Tanacetum coccineum]
MRPFGCPVTILNTLDPLGKFDGKADKGFFVGYSVTSKAFRVFNTRTRIVEESLHITFLENNPNVAGNGPTWLFDIDTLTKSMNYEPVVVGNQTNGKGRRHPKSLDDKVTDDAGKKVNDDLREATESNDQVKDVDTNSTNSIYTVSTPVNTASTNEVNVVGAKTSIELLDDPNMHALEEIVYSEDDEEVGAEADMNNLETNIPVSLIPTTRIHKDHSLNQVIGDVLSATQTRKITKTIDKHALVARIKERINHKDF